MPMWRCPHCGTPQAEAARCWVCRRSTTACGTCRNFRKAVTPGLGYCGLDRRRAVLHGDEIRPCWEPATGTMDEPVRVAPLKPSPSVAPPDAHGRDFIEVGGDAPIKPAAPPTDGWSLWGEPEA